MKEQTMDQIMTAFFIGTFVALGLLLFEASDALLALESNLRIMFQ